VSIIFYQSADCPYLIAAIAVHWCFSQIIKQHPRFHELLDQPTHCSLSSSVTGVCTVMTLPSWWHQTRGRINNVRNGWFPTSNFPTKQIGIAGLGFSKKKQKTSWLSEWLEWKTSENNRDVKSSCYSNMFGHAVVLNEKYIRYKNDKRS
jgi:hypothetical protein